MTTSPRYEVRSVLRSARIIIYVEHTSVGAMISASLYRDTKAATGALRTTMLAHAAQRQAAECRVDIEDAATAALWIGGAAFDIPAAEGRRIAAAAGLKLTGGAQ